MNSKQNKILDLFEKSIDLKSKNDLKRALKLIWDDEPLIIYKSLFKQVILASWHDFHEDIVDTVNLYKDDIFTNDLYKIATEKSKYRRHDTELESALRKCVHGLMEINSLESKKKINKLIELDNPNVKAILEMY